MVIPSSPNPSYLTKQCHKSCVSDISGGVCIHYPLNPLSKYGHRASNMKCQSNFQLNFVTQWLPLGLHNGRLVSMMLGWQKYIQLNHLNLNLVILKF